MYTVDLYRKVRRATFGEGMSIGQAARMFNLHRKTLNKMLRDSVPPGYQRAAASLCSPPTINFHHCLPIC